MKENPTISSKSIPLSITEVNFKASRPEEVSSGLLGWVSCVMNGSLRIDGLAVRRTLEGRLTVSFPSRRDRAGFRRFFLRPLTDDARREIERQIFLSLMIEEEPP